MVEPDPAVRQLLEPNLTRAGHVVGLCADAESVTLGPAEFRLLNFLMHHPERVRTRPQLLDKVWGRHAVLDERTVDAHVGRLRHALQPGGHQEHIETVRGIDYGPNQVWGSSAAARRRAS